MLPAKDKTPALMVTGESLVAPATGEQMVIPDVDREQPVGGGVEVPTVKVVLVVNALPALL